MQLSLNPWITSPAESHNDEAPEVRCCGSLVATGDRGKAESPT